ncbi:MAG: hypothetical protein ACREV4_16830 [Gammaproteobacteria bacterium]
MESGHEVGAAARQVGTTSRRLRAFCESVDALSELFGSQPPDDNARKDARQILGNLIVGGCAEITFEEIYRAHMPTTELELRDLREGRSDTDYRLFNGRGRPVYRVNIKFHGSLFRRAQEMVGLEPEDCFALATYKIDGALQKQKKDELPYIFVIVSVPDLKSESVGAAVPAELQDFVARVTVSKRIPRKRDIEDQVVQVLQQEGHPAFDATRKRIAEARWYVLGAKKPTSSCGNCCSYGCSRCARETSLASSEVQNSTCTSRYRATSHRYRRTSTCCATRDIPA